VPGAHALAAHARVILPQALRIATPPTVGFMVQIVKNTSLASVVGFVELARRPGGEQLDCSSPSSSTCWSPALYFCLCFPLVVEPRLERRLERGRPKRKLTTCPAHRQEAARPPTCTRASAR
jgi:polar amino acid transport system permease protein